MFNQLNTTTTEIDIVLHFTQGGGYLIEVDHPCDCLSVYHSVCVTISLITQKQIISIEGGMYFIMRITLQPLLKDNYN